MNEPYNRKWSIPQSCLTNVFTHHLTLAHSANSMPINTNICMFPDVRKASVMNTSKRKVKAPSTMKRKVGFREEPGLSIFARKDSSSGASGVDIANVVCHQYFGVVT